MHRLFCDFVVRKPLKTGFLAFKAHVMLQPRNISWADPEGGGAGVSGHPHRPLENHKNIEFLSKNGPDPLKNHKVTKPAFSVGTSSARL